MRAKVLSLLQPIFQISSPVFGARGAGVLRCFCFSSDLLVFAFCPFSGRVAAVAVFLEMRWQSSGLAGGVVLLLGKGRPKIHEVVEPAGFGDNVTPRFTADEHAVDARSGNSWRRFFQFSATNVVGGQGTAT